MAYKLEQTTDYDKFIVNENNREMREKPKLMSSMRKHGMMPSKPVQVVPHPKIPGKFLTICGHHHVVYAKKLGLPVWYVVDSSNTNMADLEGDPSARWSARDFAVHYSKTKNEIEGRNPYSTVLYFARKHGLNLGSAASLVGGQGGASANKIQEIRAGEFELGDMRHANAVVSVTDMCRELKMPCAVQSSFVAAVSMAVRVPGFDVSEIRRKIKLYPAKICRRSRTCEYLEEIEGLYNYGTKSKRLPIAFSAYEIARKRGRNGNAIPVPTEISRKLASASAA